MKCAKCGSEQVVKNRIHLGKQKYKCKKCAYQFTQQRLKGNSEQIKHLAILLYINGLSFRSISSILKVSHISVYNWVKKFGLQTYQKLEPEGDKDSM